VLAFEDLLRIARMREGRLEETPFAVLLYSLARTQSTVVLTMERRQLNKQIVFEGGNPIECHSNLVHETLGRFMVSIGRLSDEVFNSCLAESCARRLRFGEILIEKGLISNEELGRMLQQNLARKLLDGFSWREGVFSLHSEQVEVESPLKVNVAQLIVLGVTKFATQAQIDSSVGPLIGKPLALHPSPYFDLESISLKAAQQKLVAGLRERAMRMDQLAAMGALSYDDLTRLLYALTLIGVVIPADQVPAPAEPAPQPTKASQRQAPVELREELMRRAAGYRRKDALDLLEVGTEANPQEIEERFLAMAERFAPWRLNEPLATSARELFLASARAYAQLSDPKQREELIDRRKRAVAARPTSSAAQRFRVRTTLLDPEVQYRRGLTLINAGEYDKALVQLEYASDLDSQNAVYRSETAYCRFLLSPATAGADALDALREALRIEPGCGLAMYYAGEVLRRMGRFAEAEDYLQRAIKPMAPDRRPIEALRAMLSERKKK
jgi:hypothetical protein